MTQHEDKQPACTRCGRLLRLSTSNANRGSVIGCTHCRQRLWYENNKERVQADSKRYYKKTRKRRLMLAEQWRAAHPEQHRRNAWKTKLKNKYGLTLEQYAQMVAAQASLCFLCNQKPPNNRPLSIDHCHKEHRVRKLLCDSCNHTLGFIERDLAWVMRAIQYLSS